MIPAAGLEAVRDFSVNCQETADKLEACTKDHTDLKQEFALTGSSAAHGRKLRNVARRGTAR